MNQGWIKLHRKLLDNPITRKANWAWFWVYLLLKASHKESKFMWNGELKIIKEGQFLTGRKELSKETGVSPTSCERILRMLENGHQIGQQKTTKYRIITILNWKQYQNMDNKADNKRTTDGQQTDTYKNDKNDKNIKSSDKSPLDIKSMLKGKVYKGMERADFKVNLPIKESSNVKTRHQAMALKALEMLDCVDDQRSGVFGCYKKDSDRAILALDECVRLNKLTGAYFLWLWNKYKGNKMKNEQE